MCRGGNDGVGRCIEGEVNTLGCRIRTFTRNGTLDEPAMEEWKTLR